MRRILAADTSHFLKETLSRLDLGVPRALLISGIISQYMQKEQGIRCEVDLALFAA